MEAAKLDNSGNGSETTDSIEKFDSDKPNHLKASGRCANTAIARELTKALQTDKLTEKVEARGTRRVEERKQGVETLGRFRC